MDKLNADLTKQILVKLSEELDMALEQACVEDRKRSGENRTKPEKIREIVYSTLCSNKDDMKEELQKEARAARLGELPKYIKSECLTQAKKGCTTHVVSLPLFRLKSKLGNFYVQKLEECWAWDNNAGCAPKFKNIPSVIALIVSDLKLETRMKIQSLYVEKETRIELEISWSE